MEIQCQRSCPQKRTGGDDWPLQKVSRNENITGYSSNTVQKEQANLGMFTRKYLSVKSLCWVLFASLFTLNKMWNWCLRH